MPLRSRVTKLEHAAGVGGQCLECGGRGPGTLKFHMALDGGEAPLHDACPRCGKRSGTLIVLSAVEPEIANRHLKLGKEAS